MKRGTSPPKRQGNSKKRGISPGKKVASDIVMNSSVQKIPPVHVARQTDKVYCVVIKMHYHTEFGQSINVVGNLPELGSWKNDS